MLKILTFYFLLTAACFAFGGEVNESTSKNAPFDAPASIVAACENNLPLIDIHVQIQESPILETNEASVSELTNIALKLNNPHAQNRDILGLATMEIVWDANIKYKSFEFSNPSIHCARAEVIVDLIVLYHTVQIAKDFVPETCEYNFIREHEYKHVKVNEENLKRYAKELVDRFKANFQNKIYYGSLDSIANTINDESQNYWLPFIGEATKNIEEDGRARHQFIDTPEEYKKVDFVCSGNISRFLKRHKSVSTQGESHE